MTYVSVRCPSAPWENTSVDRASAWDLCFDLSLDYGYAMVMEGERIIGSYSDGQQD